MRLGFGSFHGDSLTLLTNKKGRQVIGDLFTYTIVEFETTDAHAHYPDGDGGCEVPTTC